MLQSINDTYEWKRFQKPLDHTLQNGSGWYSWLQWMPSEISLNNIRDCITVSFRSSLLKWFVYSRLLARYSAYFCRHVIMVFGDINTYFSNWFEECLYRLLLSHVWQRCKHVRVILGPSSTDWKQ